MKSLIRPIALVLTICASSQTTVFADVAKHKPHAANAASSTMVPGPHVLTIHASKAWQTPIDGNDQYAYAQSIRITVTTEKPDISISAGDFVGRVMTTQGFLKTLPAITSVAPPNAVPNTDEDLGSLGSVRLMPNHPATIVVTFASKTPILVPVTVVYHTAQ
jgi:hypothetical protein